MSTTAQSLTDTSLAVNGPNLASSEASRIFNADVKNSYRVPFRLLPKEKRYLERTLGFPVLTDPTKAPPTHDHAVLAAERELVRQIYDNQAELHLPVRTLVVGAAAREINRYNTNEAMHFYIANADCKDAGRIVHDLMGSILKKIKEKIRSSKFISAAKRSSQAIRKYKRMEQLYADYEETHDMKGRLHTKPDGKYPRLVFEDSIYNFSEEDLLDIFERTGATVAHGYGFFPYELVFPDIPESQLYRYRKDGNLAYVTFKQGFSCGYAHSHRSWSTLMRKVLIKGKTFALHVELTARAGEMFCFRIQKTTSPETVVRELELPADRQYVRVLDIPASWDFSKGDFKDDLAYFSVRAEEFYSTILYMHNIPDKSKTVPNAFAFVRRKAGGVSLLTAEAIREWDLAPGDVAKFVMAAFIYGKMEMEELQSIAGKVEDLIPGTFKVVTKVLKALFFAAFYPVPQVCDALWTVFSARPHLLEKIAYPGDASTLTIDSFSSREWSGVDLFSLDEMPLFPDITLEQMPDCPLCFATSGKLGPQQMICKHQEPSEHEFSLSDTQVAQVMNELEDDDKVKEPGLKTLMERVKQYVPKAGFSHKCRVHYICGPPGTGKSYLIRVLARRSDLILAPFKKLSTDYENCEDEDGEKFSFVFKTVHRALETIGHKRIFLDEFTSFRYEYLAICAYRNAAEDVYIVGDAKQTRIRDGMEGQYIGGVIDLANVSTHVLTRNFRNPARWVGLLNRLYGYQMYAVSDVKGSVEYMSVPDALSIPGANVMTFSKGTGKLFEILPEDSATPNLKFTVRSNQGTTCDTTVLLVSHCDDPLYLMQAMRIVAFSRHKTRFILAGDGSYVHTTISALLLPVNSDASLDDAARPEIDLNHKSKGNDARLQAYLDSLAEPEVVLPSATAKLVGKLHKLAMDHAGAFACVGFCLDLAAILATGHSVLGWFAGSLIDDYLAYKKAIATGDTKVEHTLSGFFSELILRVPHFNEEVADEVLSDPDGAFEFLDKAFSATEELSSASRQALGLQALKSHKEELRRLQELDAYHRKNEEAEAVRENTRLQKIAEEFLAPQAPAVPKKKTKLAPCYLSIGKPSVALAATMARAVVPYRSRTSCADLAAKTNAFSFRGEIVKKPPTLALVPAAEEVQFSETFKLHSREFDSRQFVAFRNVEPAAEDKPAPENDPKAGMDMHQVVLSEERPEWDEQGALNEVEATRIVPEFSSGTLDEDITLPMNSRGNIKPVTRQHYQFTTGIALRYSAHNPWQELATTQHRYIGPTSRRAFTYESAELAREMVSEFARECMEPGAGMRSLCDEELAEIYASWDSAAKHKCYEQQSEMPFDNPDATTIRYNMKDIAKPTKNEGKKPLDLTKPGQGISAWSKPAVSLFGSATRVINAAFQRSLKSHVVYNNGMSELELMERVNGLIGTLPLHIRAAVMDHKAYDATQNLFTQEIEKEVLRTMGVSEKYIQWYYHLRASYKLIGGCFIARVNFKKTSGEPGTLLYNSVLNAVLCNYIVRGSGPFILFVQGDDGSKSQADIAVDQDRLAKVRAHMDLQLSVDIENSYEICGMLQHKGGLYPCLSRKLKKIVSHRYRSYEHFCEYQEGLRGYIAQVKDLGLMDVLSVNAMFADTKLEVQQQIYEGIRSFASLDKEQFFEKIRVYTETVEVPVYDPNTGEKKSY